MNTNELQEILEKHKLWLEDKEGGVKADLRHSDLRHSYLIGADLSGADLSGADLRDANLSGADLDYSVFPLWCGGVGWTVDEKLPLMLAAFICSMRCESEEIKEMQKMLEPFAIKSHRAEDILASDVIEKYRGEE